MALLWRYFYFLLLMHHYRRPDLRVICKWKKNEWCNVTCQHWTFFFFFGLFGAEFRHGFFSYPLFFLATSFNSKEVTVCDSLSTGGDSLGSCPALRETLKMTRSHCLRKVLDLPSILILGPFGDAENVDRIGRMNEKQNYVWCLKLCNHHIKQKILSQSGKQHC